MILLYQLPDSEQGRLVEGFLERIEVAFRRIDRAVAGQTLRALFEGTDAAAPVADAAEEAAIFFDNAFSEDDARRILEALAQAGVLFRFQVLFSDDVADKTVADILAEHAQFQAFLKKVKHLQQLIDGCGRLSQSDYDPDRWSELKFAIADANEYLDALFSEKGEGLPEIHPEEMDRITDALQAAMNKMLTYKRPH